MSNGAPQVRIGDWVGEGWRMFVEQWQTWVLMTLVELLSVFVPLMFSFALLLLGPILAGPGRPDPSLILVLYLGAAAGFILFVVVQIYLACGMVRAALKQLRGEVIQVRDLFSGGDCFLPMLGAHFLVGLLAMVGFLFCIIPAYIVAGLYMFAGALIVDRGLGPLEAMRASFNITRSNVLMFTLFAFLVMLIGQAGSYACYVGLLATIPLQLTISIIAYRDLFGVEGARSFAAPVRHAPDYGAPPPPYGAPPYGAPAGGNPQAAYFCQYCRAPLPSMIDFCPSCGAHWR